MKYLRAEQTADRIPLVTKANPTVKELYGYVELVVDEEATLLKAKERYRRLYSYPPSEGETETMKEVISERSDNYQRMMT